jgi:hypothetical protein
MTRGEAGFDEPALGIPKEREQLVADDLDDLLARRQALQDGLVHRAIAYAIHEGLHDLEVDVSLEQRLPDFPEGVLDRQFAEARFPANGLEDVLEPLTQLIEHGFPIRRKPLS